MLDGKLWVLTVFLEKVELGWNGAEARESWLPENVRGATVLTISYSCDEFPLPVDSCIASRKMVMNP